MRARLAAAVAGLAVAACQSVGLSADEPAWIESASPESRAEIGQAIRAVLGERDILLAPDALTSSHVLLLEPAVRSQLQGPLLGRNLEAPERLELVLNEGRCYLTHASGARIRLRATRCIPARG